jgi:hypothetical protein
MAWSKSGKRTTHPVMSCATGLEYVVTEASQAAPPSNAARLFQRWKKSHTPSGTIATNDARRARRKSPCVAAVEVEADEDTAKDVGEPTARWQAPRREPQGRTRSGVERDYVGFGLGRVGGTSVSRGEAVEQQEKTGRERQDEARIDHVGRLKVGKVSTEARREGERTENRRGPVRRATTLPAR